ncbi:hypothetical protein PoB_005789100 [Plakobranchus ocellatus]|uniref:Uncharacterized protein n=1 Tax=Plakobranchus ocellatus TaxID=259542 RepID=A0AAV4CF35_9GAST|nr:hypothetical protein PoB_005789100 [Plakobranchus ocellatus]
MNFTLRGITNFSTKLQVLSFGKTLFNLTDMVTVASLTVFGSKPYRNQGDFDELAVVDIWSQTPKLTSVLDDADAVISGKTGSENDGHSYLTMSWNSPTPGYRQYYKCVANGLDHQRQATSISTTKWNLLILNFGRCQKRLTRHVLRMPKQPQLYPHRFKNYTARLR